MPQQEITYLYQQCVYWQFAGYGRDGQAGIFLPPIQLQCRWEDSWREALDKQGNTIKLDADVWIANPSSLPPFTPIPIGSILWLGPITAWYGSGSQINPPIVPTGLREVIDYKRVPDIKGRAILWRYGVFRYKDTLPTIISS